MRFEGSPLQSFAAPQKKMTLRGCEWRVIAVVKQESGLARSDPPHCSKQRVDDVLAPSLQLGRVCQVALEDR